MKKALSFIFALIIATGSFMIAIAADNNEHKALSWPENYYDFNHKAPDPSPWLGELEVGKNDVSSLLKGYYTFTAPEKGFYVFTEWFEVSQKIEGDRVTEVDCNGWFGWPVMTYLEKGVERCYRFYNNSGVEDNSDMSEPGEIEIDYIGEIVSAIPEENAHAYTKDIIYNPEDTESPYFLSGVNVALTFSEGIVLEDNHMSGKIDSTEPGRRRFTVPEVCGGPGYEFEFTLLGYKDYIKDIKLGDGNSNFNSRVGISYNDSKRRNESGKVSCLCNANTPNMITVTLKDGTVLNLKPEYYYYDCFDGFTGQIQGGARFDAADGSSHHISTGYKENENGRIVFYVRIDDVETVIEEEPDCSAALLTDFVTFFRNLTAALKADGSIPEKFEAVRTEAGTFATYLKYVFSNGYFANTGVLR
jgi:hypothetical protein